MIVIINFDFICVTIYVYIQCLLPTAYEVVNTFFLDEEPVSEW